jgi:hypothetical protein
MDKDDFYLSVAEALSGCQLVEQQLKLYIAEALELAKKCIDEKMPFKMTGEDYANEPLGKLITTFKKLSNNDALVADLNRFKDERNFISHRSITHCLDYSGELSDSDASDLRPRLKTIHDEARRLYVAIHEEANKFRGHLYFDDLTAD